MKEIELSFIKMDVAYRDLFKLLLFKYFAL